MTIDEVEKIKKVVENKDYIVQLVNIIAKTLIEAFENLKIEDVNMFQLGYNKAIDDFYIRFICEVKNRYPGMPIVDIVRNKWEQKNSQYIECEEIALKIAEQLKEGVNINEQS